MTTAPTIAATGVTLTPVTDDDAPEWLAGEDPEQVAAFEFPRAGTMTDVRNAITNWRAAWTDDGSIRHWALRTVPDVQLAGGVELRALGSWDAVNLSYVIFPAFRQRGFATSAARAAIAYAFDVLGATEISLEILQGNAASRRVAQKLGARWVGLSPSHAGSTFDRWRIDASSDAWSSHRLSVPQ
jgi:RimJ/RimL family protein N-acetyltransferase